MSAARRMAARRRERERAPRHYEGARMDSDAEDFQPPHECQAPLFAVETIGGEVLYFACHICEHQSASLITRGRREARRR